MGYFILPKGVANKRYTAEFKKQVVETMQKEKLSCCETARQFGISDHKRVAAWERIYMTEGPEGLAIERRGRGGKCRKQLPKKAEEDLLAEVQRLRAENEYLRQYRTTATIRITGRPFCKNQLGRPCFCSQERTDSSCQAGSVSQNQIR